MDSFLYLTLLTLFIAVYIKQGQTQAKPIVLSSLKAVVPENNSVALTCSNTTGTLSSSYWKTSLYDDQRAFCLRLEASCVKTDFLNNSVLYDCICNNNGSYTVLLKHVDRYQHGSIWTCGIRLEKSNTVVINVSVPVTKAVLTHYGNVSIYENTNATFKCSTSYSLPSAQIKWYRSYKKSTLEITDSQDVDIKRATHNREDNVIRVTESLSYRVNRSVNGWSVYCTATNLQDNLVTSEKTNLSVIYPPNGPPVINGFINGSTNTITENETVSLSCTAKGGNPLAKLEWYCDFNNNKTREERINETVTSYISWIAKRTYGKTCTCRMIHVLLNVSSFVNVDILYPPSLPEFYIHSKVGRWQKVSSEINIRENNSLRIKCSSESNPNSTCSWTGPSSSNNEMLKLNVTNSRTEESYICTARNIMTQTNGTSLEGMKNNSIRVNVLYPPSNITFTIRNQSTDISVSKHVNVIENNSYILTCYARGKPEPTLSWTGPINVSSNALHFTNINRNNAGYYTCVAKNTINESTGTIYNEQENKTIYLNIQYASEVTEFFVAGHKENYLAITNQKENATFHCNVDSNPTSAIGLQFNERLLISNTNARNLSYSIMNLTFSNAGIYYCYSSNKINNGKRSRKQLTIIVKCPPLPEKDLHFHVTTLKYVPATLRFKAMDYLDIRNTSFTWQREINTSQWETIKNGTQKVKISTFNLQTNLTILNVTGSYSGKYRVVYNNSVGGNTQSFELFVADLPDPPTHFDYLKESVTSTNVTVVWTKGYSGGLRQTFVLNISQKSQHIIYDYINETENEDMQHTITGLSSGTRYLLTLWATNKLGKSSSQTLTIITKEPETKATPSSTAAIAGSVSSLVTIISVVSIAFLLYKRRYQKKTADRSNLGKSFDDGCEMKAHSDGDIPVKREPVYEGLKPTNERGYVKEKEQTYDTLEQKQDSSVTKDPVYTNLTLCHTSTTAKTRVT